MDYDFNVIFQGPNGEPTNNWDNLRQEFKKSITQLIRKGLQPHRTIVLGPLPRGPDTTIWETQMRTSDKIIDDMHQLGLNTLNVYQNIPQGMRNPKMIFGRNDLRRGHFVHYGQRILDMINDMTESKILELMTNQGKEK